MQIAILTNMKLSSDVIMYPNVEKPTYCIFYASSVFPDRKGVYFKASCRATGFSMELIKTLKLHQGSIVNIQANINQYPKGDSIETTYEITSVTIVNEFFNEPEKLKEEANASALNNFVQTLANDAFGKKGGTQ